MLPTIAIARPLPPPAMAVVPPSTWKGGLRARVRMSASKTGTNLLPAIYLAAAKAARFLFIVTLVYFDLGILAIRSQIVEETSPLYPGPVERQRRLLQLHRRQRQRI